MKKEENIRKLVKKQVTKIAKDLDISTGILVITKKISSMIKKVKE